MDEGGVVNDEADDLIRSPEQDQDERVGEPTNRFSTALITSSMMCGGDLDHTRKDLLRLLPTLSHLDPEELLVLVLEWLVETTTVAGWLAGDVQELRDVDVDVLGKYDPMLTPPDEEEES